MPRGNGLATTPEFHVLEGFLKAGKTIDWISEKWNVTPQTVRAWLAKFHLSLPKKQSEKTTYNRKLAIKEKKACPVCHEANNVNYIFAEKHWYCMNCCTEFDQNNVIYVYDDMGDLIEVIAHTPGVWDKLKIGKKSKKIICTTTV